MSARSHRSVPPGMPCDRQEQALNHRKHTARGRGGGLGFAACVSHSTLNIAAENRDSYFRQLAADMQGEWQRRRAMTVATALLLAATACLVSGPRGRAPVLLWSSKSEEIAHLRGLITEVSSVKHALLALEAKRAKLAKTQDLAADSEGALGRDLGALESASSRLLATGGKEDLRGYADWPTSPRTDSFDYGAQVGHQPLMQGEWADRNIDDNRLNMIPSRNALRRVNAEDPSTCVPPGCVTRSGLPLGTVLHPERVPLMRHHGVLMVHSEGEGRQSEPNREQAADRALSDWIEGDTRHVHTPRSENAVSSKQRQSMGSAARQAPSPFTPFEHALGEEPEQQSASNESDLREGRSSKEAGSERRQSDSRYLVDMSHEARRHAEAEEQVNRSERRMRRADVDRRRRQVGVMETERSAQHYHRIAAEESKSDLRRNVAASSWAQGEAAARERRAAQELERKERRGGAGAGEASGRANWDDYRMAAIQQRFVDKIAAESKKLAEARLQLKMQRERREMDSMEAEIKRLKQERRAVSSGEDSAEPAHATSSTMGHDQLGKSEVPATLEQRVEERAAKMAARYVVATLRKVGVREVDGPRLEEEPGREVQHTEPQAKEDGTRPAREATRWGRADGLGEHAHESAVERRKKRVQAGAKEAQGMPAAEGPQEGGNEFDKQDIKRGWSRPAVQTRQFAHGHAHINVVQAVPATPIAMAWSVGSGEGGAGHPALRGVATPELAAVAISSKEKPHLMSTGALTRRKMRAEGAEMLPSRAAKRLGERGEASQRNRDERDDVVGTDWEQDNASLLPPPPKGPLPPPRARAKKGASRVSLNGQDKGPYKWLGHTNGGPSAKFALSIGSHGTKAVDSANIAKGDLILDGTAPYWARDVPGDLPQRKAAFKGGDKLMVRTRPKRACVACPSLALRSSLCLLILVAWPSGVCTRCTEPTLTRKIAGRLCRQSFESHSAGECKT